MQISNATSRLKRRPGFLERVFCKSWNLSGLPCLAIKSWIPSFLGPTPISMLRKCEHSLSTRTTMKKMRLLPISGKLLKRWVAKKSHICFCSSLLAQDPQPSDSRQWSQNFVSIATMTPTIFPLQTRVWMFWGYLTTKTRQSSRKSYCMRFSLRLGFNLLDFW